MKIRKDVLKEYLHKIKMDGSEIMSEALFNFTDNGLQVNFISAANTVMVSSTLNTTAFVEYEAIKEVGVQYIPELYKIIETLGDEIILTVTGNILTLKSDGKTVDVELMDSKLLRDVPNKPLPEFTENFEIDGNKIQKFLSDISINKEPKVILTTQPGKLLLKNTGKFKFTYEVPVEQIKGNVTSRYAIPFVSVMKQLEGKLTIRLSDSFPLVVEQVTDKYKLKFIIAPIMNTDE